MFFFFIIKCFKASHSEILQNTVEKADSCSGLERKLRGYIKALCYNVKSHVCACRVFECITKHLIVIKL